MKRGQLDGKKRLGILVSGEATNAMGTGRSRNILREHMSVFARVYFNGIGYIKFLNVAPASSGA